jgi:hypothetical protein
MEQGGRYRFLRIAEQDCASEDFNPGQILTSIFINAQPTGTPYIMITDNQTR